MVLLMNKEAIERIRYFKDILMLRQYWESLDGSDLNSFILLWQSCSNGFKNGNTNESFSNYWNILTKHNSFGLNDEGINKFCKATEDFWKMIYANPNQEGLSEIIYVLFHEDKDKDEKNDNKYKNNEKLMDKLLKKCERLYLTYTGSDEVELEMFDYRNESYFK